MRVQYRELQTMPKHLIACALLMAALHAAGQATTPDAPAPLPPASALHGPWDPASNNARADQWQLANSRSPGAMAQWNWFQSEYNAMNSKGNATLATGDRRELQDIAGLIRAAAPASFERHMAEYFLAFPEPDAYTELEAARQLGPDRAELISPMLNKALRDGDETAVRHWGSQLAQRGQVAPALLATATDMLLSVPVGAVLFTNGDMDGQPAVLRQLEQAKPDVLLVDRRLLADAAYRHRIWKRAGGTGATPGYGPAFARSLVKQGKRPVYFALSLAPQWLKAFPGELNAVGAAFRVGPPTDADQEQLEANWQAMQKPLDAGPLSRNYLVPGAVLLGHYRQSGQYAKAAALEQELRNIATATGALHELQTKGILKP